MALDLIDRVATYPKDTFASCITNANKITLSIELLRMLYT